MAPVASLGMREVLMGGRKDIFFLGGPNKACSDFYWLEYKRNNSSLLSCGSLRILPVVCTSILYDDKCRELIWFQTNV